MTQILLILLASWNLFAEFNVCNYPDKPAKESDPQMIIAGDDRFWPWTNPLELQPADWRDLDGVWKLAHAKTECTNRLAMRTLLDEKDLHKYPEVKVVMFEPTLCRVIARGLGKATAEKVTVMMTRRGGSTLGYKAPRAKDEVFGLSVRHFGDYGMALRSFLFQAKTEPPIGGNEKVPALVKETSLMYTDLPTPDAKKAGTTREKVRVVIPCGSSFIEL